MSEKSPWQIWKEKNEGDSVRPWDLINPNINNVPEDTFNHRFEICKNCPSLIKITNQCKKCGCFMNAKAKLPHATCPIGKWGAYHEVPDLVKEQGE